MAAVESLTLAEWKARCLLVNRAFSGNEQGAHQIAAEDISAHPVHPLDVSSLVAAYISARERFPSAAPSGFQVQNDPNAFADSVKGMDGAAVKVALKKIALANTDHVTASADLKQLQHNEAQARYVGAEAGFRHFRASLGCFATSRHTCRAV